MRRIWTGLSRLACGSGLVLLLCVAGPLTAAAASEPLISEASRQRLVDAIASYRSIVADGGWPVVPEGPLIEPGAQDPRLPVIRARLLASGHLVDSSAMSSTDYDSSLADDVRVFQRHHGVLPDGRIGPATVRAMAIPASWRLAQLVLAARRLDAIAERIDSARYVLVNIPALELFAVRDGDVELVSAVVIGKTGRQTPELSSRITAVNFHPTWHVPHSIASRDLFPLLQSNPGYLAREGYQFFVGIEAREIPLEQVIERRLTPEQVWLRKPPGPSNPLGRIRLDMPNDQAIFLHDSPATWLFSRPARAFSSGCVRVARIVELSHWLLAQPDRWTLDAIGRVLHGREPLTVSLQEPVPVHLVYLTAWVDQAGQVQFRPDLYNRDEQAFAD